MCIYRCDWLQSAAMPLNNFNHKMVCIDMEFVISTCSMAFLACSSASLSFLIILIVISLQRNKSYQLSFSVHHKIHIWTCIEWQCWTLFCGLNACSQMRATTNTVSNRNTTNMVTNRDNLLSKRDTKCSEDSQKGNHPIGPQIMYIITLCGDKIVSVFALYALCV